MDIVPGRTVKSAAGWFKSQPKEWHDGIRWAVSGHVRTAIGWPCDKVLPHARQVAASVPRGQVGQPATRRSPPPRSGTRPWDTEDQRGDPLYRIRRLLTMAEERLDSRGHDRIRGLLAAGDPYSEVGDAWYAKESVRDIYQIPDPKLADEFPRQLATDLQDPSLPPEIQTLLCGAELASMGAVSLAAVKVGLGRASVGISPLRRGW